MAALDVVHTYKVHSHESQEAEGSCSLRGYCREPVQEVKNKLQRRCEAVDVD
jgi:hypothetical protein